MFNKLWKRFAHRNTSGFTILEVLAVIAIIGVLSSIILGNFSEYRAKARLARAQAIMAGLVPAINLCNLDELDIRTCGAWPNCGTSQICEGEGHAYWPIIPPEGGWAYTTSIPTEGENQSACLSPNSPSCYCTFKSPYQNPEICARGNTTNPNQKYGIRCTLAGCKTFIYTCTPPNGPCSQP